MLKNHATHSYGMLGPLDQKKKKEKWKAGLVLNVAGRTVFQWKEAQKLKRKWLLTIVFDQNPVRTLFE